MESKTLGSAFQPVQAPPTQGPRKVHVTFDPIQEKNQEEKLELQHKLTKLDAENKRLQVNQLTACSIVISNAVYCYIQSNDAFHIAEIALILFI